jgi:hypothetical protein
MMLGQLVRMLRLLGMMLQELGRLHPRVSHDRELVCSLSPALLLFLSGQFGRLGLSWERAVLSEISNGSERCCCRNSQSRKWDVLVRRNGWVLVLPAAAAAPQCRLIDASQMLQLSDTDIEIASHCNPDWGISPPQVSFRQHHQHHHANYSRRSLGKKVIIITIISLPLIEHVLILRDAWRYQGIFSTWERLRPKNTLPGLGIGTGAFLVYLAADFLFSKPASHGHSESHEKASH